MQKVAHARRIVDEKDKKAVQERDGEVQLTSIQVQKEQKWLVASMQCHDIELGTVMTEVSERDSGFGRPWYELMGSET